MAGENFDFIVDLSRAEIQALLFEESNGYLSNIAWFEGFAIPERKFIKLWHAQGRILRRSLFHLQSFHPELHRMSVYSADWDPPDVVVSFPRFKPGRQKKRQRSVEEVSDSCQLLLPL